MSKYLKNLISKIDNPDATLVSEGIDGADVSGFIDTGSYALNALLSGSIFGGLFVLFVPNIAESISRSAPGVIYGMILIVFLFVLPEGFAGLVRRLLAKLSSPGNPQPK